MKKFVISLAILGIFVIYSIGINHVSPVIKKPLSLVTNNSNPSTTSTSASGNSNSAGSAGTSNSSASQYKDGKYTGSISNAYYGNVQVAVTISGGKITNVKFLQYPNSHPTSVAINQQVIPYLQQETIQAQSANVQLISGATFTSEAFIQSLSAALSQA